MSWNETSTGVFQRPLGATEMRQVELISADRRLPREPIRIHAMADFTASRSVESVIQAFRESWKALRLLRSPNIATTFENGNKVYRVPSDEELEAWLNQTFKVAPTGTSVEATVTDMQTRVELLPVCYLLPQKMNDRTFKGSIMLFISHWRTEAAGCFKMLNQIFDYVTDFLNGTATREALRNHVAGSETHLLTPAVEDIMMPDKKSSPAAKDRVARRVSKYSSTLPSVDLPLHNSSSAAPSNAKLIRSTYTPASTSSFTKACEATNISVTAAIHAAYLDVVWQIALPEKRYRNYSCLMPAQVRTRLPYSSQFRHQGCWNALQVLFISVPPGRGILATARDLSQQYKVANEGAWQHEDMHETTNQIMEKGARFGPQQAMPCIMSIGVLDRELLIADHGELQVERVEVWADPVRPGVVLTMLSFRGRLNIQVTWNAAFHRDVQVQQIMDRIENTLRGEFGVEMQIEEVRKVTY